MHSQAQRQSIEKLSSDMQQGVWMPEEALPRAPACTGAVSKVPLSDPTCGRGATFRQMRTFRTLFSGYPFTCTLPHVVQPAWAPSQKPAAARAESAPGPVQGAEHCVTFCDKHLTIPSSAASCKSAEHGAAWEQA